MNTPEQLKTPVTKDNYKTYTWYKVTTSNKKAVYGKGGYCQWWRWLVGGWHISTNIPSICFRGFHATLEPRRWCHSNTEKCRVFEVEVSGFGEQEDDKACFRAIKFGKEIERNSQEWQDLKLPTPPVYLKTEWI